MGLNDDLADDAALHALAIESATLETQAKVAKVLSDMQDDLEKSILKAGAGSDVSKSKKAIAALNKKTDQIITQALSKAQGLTDAELAAFAQESSLMMLESVQDSLTDWPLNVLNKQELLTVAKGNAIMGTPAADYWAGQDVATRTKFKRLMDQGVLQGLTNAELVRSVAGTKALNFNDGIMRITRSQAEGLVRTSVMNVSNKARQATYKKNSDLIKGVQHISTLDDRTSEICQARSGSVYEIDQLTGDFLPATTGFTFDGGPPYHIRCRSTTAPIVRSWDELNRSKDPETIEKVKKFRPTPSTRASMDGQVPESTTFAAFAKKKGDSFIKDVLPPGKAQLVINGDISMRDLIDNHGRVRSLGQLQALKGGQKSKSKGLRIPDIRSKQVRLGPRVPTATEAAAAAKAVETAKEAALIATEHAKMVALSKALNKKGVKNAAFALDADQLGLKGIKSNIALLKEMEDFDLAEKAKAAAAAKKADEAAKKAKEEAEKKLAIAKAKALAEAKAAEAKAKALAEKQAAALKKAQEEAAAVKKAAALAEAKAAKIKAEAEAIAKTVQSTELKMKSIAIDQFNELKKQVLDVNPKVVIEIFPADPLNIINKKIAFLKKKLEAATAGTSKLQESLAGEIMTLQGTAKLKKVDLSILGLSDDTFETAEELLKKTPGQLVEIKKAAMGMIKVADQAIESVAEKVTEAIAKIPIGKMKVAELKAELQVLAQAKGKKIAVSKLKKAELINEIEKLKAPIPTTGRILPKKPSLIAEGNFPHPDEVTVVGQLGGSTGAQKVRGPDGKLYVMKKGGGGNAADHIRQELITDNAYRAAGVNVPEAVIFETKDGPVKLARFLEGDSLNGWASKATPAQIKAMKKTLSEDFHMDAVMGNWDVVGMSGDNILIDKAGKPWRIDNGGSMQFRAQGGIKEGRQWNGHPSELWSMRGRAVAKSDAVADIYGLNNAETARWFGDADIFEISEQIQRTDWAAVKAVTSDPVLLTRIEHMERLAKKGIGYRTTNFAADRADPIMMHMNALNQEGLTDAMPTMMKRKGSGRSVTFVDEFGQEWGGLRGSGGGIKPVVFSDDPYMADLLGALKTVGYHNKQGDLTYNTDAIKKAMAAVNGIKQSGNAALKKHHAGVIKWMDEHGNKGLLAKKMPDPPANVTEWIDTAKKASAKAPAKINPTTALWDHIEDTLGLPLRHIGDWQSSQAGSSWAPEVLKFKNWVKKGIRDFDADAVWSRRTSKEIYSAAEEQALEVHQAFVQELLGKTKFEGNWPESGAMRIFRTESADDLSDIYNMPRGTTKDFARGLNESHSPFTPKEVLAGKEVTVTAMPHTKVTGVYWMERPRTGGTGFAEDAMLENEFTAIPYKIPTHRLGDVYKIDLDAIIAEGKELTIDQFAAKYNIPISSFLDL